MRNRKCRSSAFCATGCPVEMRYTRSADFAGADMCQLEMPGLSRRNFGLLAVSALSISMFPLAARAAGHAEALALICIDYRLVDAAAKFYDETLHLKDEYDHVGLAGASLAAVSPKFPSSNAAFWDHV